MSAWLFACCTWLLALVLVPRVLVVNLSGLPRESPASILSPTFVPSASQPCADARCATCAEQPYAARDIMGRSAEPMHALPARSSAASASRSAVGEALRATTTRGGEAQIRVRERGPLGSSRDPPPNWRGTRGRTGA